MTSQSTRLLDFDALLAWARHLPADVWKYDFTYWLHCPPCGLVKIGGTDQFEQRWSQLRTKHRRDCLAWTGVPGRLRLIAIAPGNWQSPFHRHFRRLKVKGEWCAYTWVMHLFLAKRGITDLPKAPEWTPEMVRRMTREFKGAARFRGPPGSEGEAATVARRARKGHKIAAALARRAMKGKRLARATMPNPRLAFCALRGMQTRDVPDNYDPNGRLLCYGCCRRRGWLGQVASDGLGEEKHQSRRPIVNELDHGYRPA
jgi:hypothetical protein